MCGAHNEMGGHWPCSPRRCASQARRFVSRVFPSLDPSNVLVLMRCLYQMSPDRQMILGPLDEDPDIVVACGFSGGGFQHAPAIGAFLAALVVQRRSGGIELESDLHRAMAQKFRLGRFDLA